jgi:hypothetical protein
MNRVVALQTPSELFANCLSDSLSKLNNDNSTSFETKLQDFQLQNPVTIRNEDYWPAYDVRGGNFLIDRAVKKEQEYFLVAC